MDSGAVPDASTINTFTECLYDGGEIGFDMWASLQNTTANSNFAPSDYALAA